MQRSGPGRDPFPDPVFVSKRRLPAGQWQARVWARKALQRIVAAPASDTLRRRDSGGFEFGGGHGRRVEYPGRERARAAENSRLKLLQLGLLVADAMLQRGHLVADGHCRTVGARRGSALGDSGRGAAPPW